MKNNHLVILLVVALLAACQAELPEGILSERKMERVLYDYHKAQGMADIGVLEGRNDEVQRYELQEAVFRKHKITRADFDSSMNYYCSNLERLNKIYMRLDRRLKREAEAMGEVEQSGNVYKSLSLEGDTANVWGGAQVIVLTNNPGDNVAAWRQPCDSTWLSDDDLMWHFEHKYLARDGQPELFADLIVTYTNDSVRAIQRRVHNNHAIDLRQDTPKGWVPRTIAGHLFMKPERDAGKRIVIITTNHLLVRFHKNRDDKAEADSMTVDSLKRSIEGTDSILIDSIDGSPLDGSRRLTPTEFRNRQPVDQKIDVVKEKPYQPSARPTRNHLQPVRRPLKR